jgi:hypothetical protein
MSENVAKAAGLYAERPENKTRNAAISSLLRDGRSWRDIMDADRMQPNTAREDRTRSPPQDRGQRGRSGRLSPPRLPDLFIQILDPLHRLFNIHDNDAD